MRNIGLLVLLIVLVLAYGGISGGGGGSGGSNRAELNLRVQTAAHQIIVTNNASQTISNCEVILGDGFRRDGLNFPPNEAVTIASASFIKGGVRFLPNIDSPDRVHVICSEPRFADAVFRDR